MLGAILLSEYNEVIHTFTNFEFRKTLANKSSNIDFQLNSQSNIDVDYFTSSSGISSSSVDSLLIHEKNANNDDKRNQISGKNLNGKLTSKNYNLACEKHNQLKSFRKFEISQNVILEKVLPLVVMYRRHQELVRTNLLAPPKDFKTETLQLVEGEKLKFNIVDYEFSFIVVFISHENQSEAVIKMFNELIIRCLNFHYGPYVHLIQNSLYGDLPTQIQKRAKFRMEKLMQSFDKFPLYRDIFNVNLMHENAETTESLMPLFKNITAKISQTLDRNCRCIFVNSGQIIASLCSDEKSLSLFQTFPAEEIASLLEFSLLPSDVRNDTVLPSRNSNSSLQGLGMTKPLLPADLKRCLKCQVEQAWLYSNLLGRRQLVNVYVFSLTGEIELICISNAHFAHAITSITDCLKCLETKIAPYFQHCRTDFNAKQSAHQKRLLKNRLRSRKQSLSEESTSTINESIMSVNDGELDCVDGMLKTENLLNKIDILLKDFQIITNVLSSSQTAATSTYSNIPNLRNKSEPDLTKDYVYLTNIERTQKLIKSLWNRLCHELIRFYQQHNNVEFQNRNSNGYYCYLPSLRYSLTRIGSSLSLISNNSSVPSDAVAYSTFHSGTGSNETGISRTALAISNVSDKLQNRISLNTNSAFSLNTRIQRVTPAHLEAMLRQLRRVIKAILIEIATYSFAIAQKRQLPNLHALLSQTIDLRVTTLLNYVLNKIVNAWRFGNPLRPLRLELNMLAFWFDRSDVPFNYYYIPDAFQAIYSKIGKIQLDSNLFVARTLEGHLLIQISTLQNNSIVQPPKKKFFLGVLNKILLSKRTIQYNTIQEGAKTSSCLAIFPEYINVALAIRQINQLILLLDVKINSILKYF